VGIGVFLVLSNSRNYLYKYPQQAYPYARLLEENRRRGKHEPEYELLDTGVFEENRYFDVVVEYAKADVEDILIRISVTNRGPEPASLDLLPTIWFRNTWAWDKNEPCPLLRELIQGKESAIQLDRPGYGPRVLYLENAPRLRPYPRAGTSNSLTARVGWQCIASTC
jgi:hypothetical protein